MGCFPSLWLGAFSMGQALVQKKSFFDRVAFPGHNRGPEVSTMLVPHFRNMRAACIAFASVKLAPVRTTVCRIEGVTRRRLSHLDAHDQRNTMAMMLAAECPFVRLTTSLPPEGTSVLLTSNQAHLALSRLHYVPCGACGAARGNHVSRCPLA